MLGLTGELCRVCIMVMYNHYHSLVLFHSLILVQKCMTKNDGMVRQDGILFSFYAALLQNSSVTYTL